MQESKNENEIFRNVYVPEAGLSLFILQYSSRNLLSK